MNLIKTAGGGSCLMESLSGDLTGGTEESNVNIEIAGLRANILNEAILSTK
jgi:hypothetical protein